MKEADLITLIVRTLKQQWGKSVVIHKNHGNRFQEAGRPDLEGGLFGRHFLIEAKTNTRFTGVQKTKLFTAARAGSLAGGVVFVYNTVYWLTVNQCVNFSLRDRKNWLAIGNAKEIRWEFLYRYVEPFVAYYHGALDELSGS